MVHNGFIDIYRVVGRQGVDLKEIVSDFCIEVVCTMRVIGLIRNFFEEVLGLVARYSRTFLVRNSELFRAKAC